MSILVFVATKVATKVAKKAVSDGLALQAITAKNLGNNDAAAAWEAASKMVHQR